MRSSPRRNARSRLQPVDELAVIRDYAAGVGILGWTEIHDVGLSRLYRILADHGVERRGPGQQRLGETTREKILLEYRRGDLVAEIAPRHGVSTSTVSNIGGAHAYRWPDRSRERLVDLIVDWFFGAKLSTDDLDAIRRVGVTHVPGIAAIEHVVPELRDDIRRRLIDELQRRGRVDAGTAVSNDDAARYPGAGGLPRDHRWRDPG